jgi:hypothetical protein
VTKEPIDPKDVASATAVGAASRLGVARHRQRGDEAAQGSASGLAAGHPRKKSGSVVVTALVVIVVIVGLLFVMLRFAQ